tara:strand:- start:91 stop:714 length:624 start_codon:yes stop_codon:yes gene_type:complete
MALVIKDRVKETTTTDGSGTISLAGAVDGFQTFVSAVGDGNTTYYAIEDANGTSWEVGIATITDGSPDTLARTTVLASSNSNNALDLTVGTHTVFGTYPADKAVFLDADGKSNTASPYNTITGDTTLTTANGVVFANASSGEVDVTLYTADSNGGMQVIVKKTDSSSNAVNILRAGSDTIDGTTSVAILHQNESVTLVSDNSNWFIV